MPDISLLCSSADVYFTFYFEILFNFRVFVAPQYLGFDLYSLESLLSRNIR